MIIKILILLFLALICVYSHTQKNKSPLISFAVVFISLLGGYFVLFPSHANVVASTVGVGRGADLMLYFWVLITFVFITNIHLKLRKASEQVTKLSRSIALMKADYEYFEKK